MLCEQLRKGKRRAIVVVTSQRAVQLQPRGFVQQRLFPVGALVDCVRRARHDRHMVFGIAGIVNIHETMVREFIRAGGREIVKIGPAPATQVQEHEQAVPATDIQRW